VTDHLDRLICQIGYDREIETRSRASASVRVERQLLVDNDPDVANLRAVSGAMSIPLGRILGSLIGSLG